MRPASLPQCEDDEHGSADTDACQGSGAAPTPVRAFDDGVDDGGHTDRRQDKTDDIDGVRCGVARRRHEQPCADDGDDGDRNIDEEERSPGEVFEQPPAGDRACGHPDAGHGGPQADCLGPLSLIDENVRDQRECRREYHGSADAHRGARDDQGVGRVHLCRYGGRPREQGETDAEPAASAETVAQAARRQQQAGDDEGVGIHDPLQLRGVRVQLTRERGQGDVDDGCVDADDEDAQADHGKRGAGVSAESGVMSVSSHVAETMFT